MTEETKLHESDASEGKSPDTENEEIRDAENIGEANLSDAAAVKRGDIVKGKVEKVEDNQVFVDIGYKYDGIIPIRELSSIHVEKASDVLAPGQEVECKVLSIDDDKEKLILSKRAVDSERAWEVLESRFQNNEVFEATVADVVKGGLVVDLGVRGFIPASMVERHFVEDFSDYKGRTLRVKIKELDRENNKVILSQRDVLEEEFQAKKQEILSKLQPGQELEGTVQRIAPFGVFVDIGGIDGLVHISEIAWSHVEKPEDVVQLGDRVKVKVLKVNPENERISLSMKASQPSPWDVAAERFKPGDVITGTVKRLVSFGAFVEIAPGVEGLVHISQISHRHIGTPHEVLKEGEEVKVKLLDINPVEKRASLSIKETEEKPAEKEKDEQYEANNQGLSLTLGERFGDKLSQLK
jgi:small subunit ribosomal protein S1